MECAEIQLRLTDFDDGNLGPKEWETVQSHLKECVACKGIYARLRESWDLLGQLPALDPDPFSRRRFFSKLYRKKSFGKAAGFAAAICLALFVLLALQRHPAQPTAGQTAYTSQSTSSEYGFPFLQSARIFPDPYTSGTGSGRVTVDLSTFNLGSVNGPIEETTFEKEETP